MRLHRGVRHFARNVAMLHHHVSLGKALVRIAKNVVIIFFNIVRPLRMDPVLLRLHRVFRIKPRRQLLILHFDQLQRALRNRLRRGDNAGHVVAHVPHFLDGQRRLVMPHGQNAVFVRRVRPSHHAHHALDGFGLRRVNLLDPRVRIGRMQDLAGQHARQRQVVSILALARGLARRIDQGNAFPDD